MGASPQGFESLRFRQIAAVAQVVEHILGKDEVTSSSLVSSSKTAFQKKRCFFYILAYGACQNIKSRFLLKTVRSCWRLHSDREKYCVLFSVYVRLHQHFKRTNFIEMLAPALLQIKILRAFLCIRLSSSAAVNHSIVKKMFWVVAFIYILAYNACKNIKAQFLFKTVRSCRRHRTTIENTSCSHRLCLSSSAVQADKFY